MPQYFTASQRRVPVQREAWILYTDNRDTLDKKQMQSRTYIHTYHMGRNVCNKANQTSFMVYLA